MVTLIGMGAGLSGSLTAEGLAALQQADLILGARRLLEHLPDGCTEHRKALYKPEEILTCLAEHPEGDTALLYSGDTGCHRRLLTSSFYLILSTLHPVKATTLEQYTAHSA